MIELLAGLGAVRVLRTDNGVEFVEVDIKGVEQEVVDLIEEAQDSGELWVTGSEGRIRMQPTAVRVQFDAGVRQLIVSGPKLS